MEKMSEKDSGAINWDLLRAEAIAEAPKKDEEKRAEACTKFWELKGALAGQKIKNVHYEKANEILKCENQALKLERVGDSNRIAGLREANEERKAEIKKLKESPEAERTCFTCIGSLEWGGGVPPVCCRVCHAKDNWTEKPAPEESKAAIRNMEEAINTVKKECAACRKYAYCRANNAVTCFGQSEWEPK